MAKEDDPASFWVNGPTLQGRLLLNFRGFFGEMPTTKLLSKCHVFASWVFGGYIDTNSTSQKIPKALRGLLAHRPEADQLLGLGS